MQNTFSRCISLEIFLSLNNNSLDYTISCQNKYTSTSIYTIVHTIKLNKTVMSPFYKLSEFDSHQSNF